jgi:hypothetical protein
VVASQRDTISPNKNAGFQHFFSCNFLSGVVISGRTIPPVLLARRRGGQSRGIFLSGERARGQRGAELLAAVFFTACATTQRSIQKEDTSTNGKCKEDDKDAADD